MTSAKEDSKLLKSDARGRVRTPRLRQESLLDEFEKSGVSGARFAALAGLKYPTFASGVLRRRRPRSTPVAGPPGRDPAATVRWLEAVVEQAGGRTDAAGAGLTVHLPGGARLELAHVAHVPLAAALLQTLAGLSPSC